MTAPDHFGTGKQLERKTTMIGAAVEFRTLGGYHFTPQRIVPSMVRLPGRYRRYASQDEETARSNVSGPRQTKCHDFPDIEPDEPEPTILEDVEPVSDEPPLDTVETSGSPRQDGVQYLVWSCLTKTPIAEMVAELQPHDRDDLRQDMAMKYWRKAVRQELRGQRISNLTKWLTADVRQWIGERTDIAIAGPETKAETEERKAILSCPIGGTKTPTADESAAVQREKSTESRLAMLDHELRIEQSRFAAEIEAKHRAAKPKAILALKW